MHMLMNYIQPLKMKLKLSETFPLRTKRQYDRHIHGKTCHPICESTNICPSKAQKAFSANIVVSGSPNVAGEPVMPDSDKYDFHRLGL